MEEQDQWIKISISYFTLKIKDKIIKEKNAADLLFMYSIYFLLEDHYEREKFIKIKLNWNESKINKVTRKLNKLLKEVFYEVQHQSI